MNTNSISVQLGTESSLAAKLDVETSLAAEIETEASFAGQLGAGAAVVNDYLIRTEEIEDGHRLTITRGSEVQSIDVLNGTTEQPGVYEVGAGRQFESFTECLRALKDDDREKTIDLYEGTYDVYSELDGQSNPVVPPNTQIVGHGRVELMASDGSSLSIVNLSGSAKLKNLTITCGVGDTCVRANGSSKYKSALWEIENCTLDYPQAKISFGDGGMCCVYATLRSGVELHLRNTVCKAGADKLKGTAINLANRAISSKVSPRVRIEDCALDGDVHLYSYTDSTVSPFTVVDVQIENSHITGSVYKEALEEMDEGYMVDCYRVTCINTPHTNSSYGVANLIPDVAYDSLDRQNVVRYSAQTLTEARKTQARTNIGAAYAEDTKIIKRTGTLPDHDGLPLTGKTITLRGGIFENAHNYVMDARNLIPYPYSFGKASPRLGISFSNIGRLLYVSGTSEKSNENFRFTERVPLPEGISPGDSLTFRLFSTAVCPSSFSLRVYFYNEAGTQTKNTLTATAYENSKTFTVPADAVSMECILYLPAVDNAIDAMLMPVLLRADDAVEQYDPLAEGALLTIPAAFDGASHLSSFPCDARVEYGMRVQAYIDEDRSYITPEAFGAEGNGNTDDTQAFLAALNYAQEKGIALRAARKYLLRETLRIQTDGADVDIHELIYQGAGAAISVEASDVHLRAHQVSSSAAGIVLQSDTSAILRCELHLGSVYASGHALDLKPTNDPISINNISFVTLDAGGVGSCVHYDSSKQVEGAYCTEINYYGGIVQRGQWGFEGILGNAKIINVNIENNVYGGILTYGDIYTFGLRIVEDMRDLPGPLLKISGRPKGTLHAQTAIDLSRIDLSEAIDWYTSEGSSVQKTMYNGETSLKIVNDVSNTLGEKVDGNTGFKAASVLGRQAIIIGKKIIIQRLYETKRVITEAELDLSANAVDLNVSKLIPTIYEAGAAMSIVRLHPSFVSFGHDTVTVIQTDEYKLTLYDCEGHLVFDGVAHGAGTYRLRAYHDYDDDAGKNYALHLPLIDYSREKWMMVN